jgi:hypothetical protein
MRRPTTWIAASIIAAVCAAGVLRIVFKGGDSIQGVTLAQDADVRRQAPIPGVEITAAVGAEVVHGTSDASGAFRLPLKGSAWLREKVELQFGVPDTNH